MNTPLPRFDIYAFIHKGLRLFMSDTLTRLGQLDLADGQEMDTVCNQVQDLLDFCRHHLHTENSFVHPLLEARRPGASARIGGEHDEHLEAMDNLLAELRALRLQPQPAAAQRLYRQLSRFVAENLEHMLVEETRHNALLWELYSDAELLDLQDRILQSLDDSKRRTSMRWMLPALSPAERSAVLMGMPAPARAPMLVMLRPHLGDAAWAKLCRSLQLAPAPGLVET